MIKYLIFFFIFVILISGYTIIAIENEKSNDIKIQKDEMTTEKKAWDAKEVTITGATVSEEKATGDFILRFETPLNPELSVLKEALESEDIIQKRIRELNTKIKMSQDMPITFTECEVSNAFYNSETKEIVICYELVVDIIETFLNKLESEVEEDKAILDTTTFILYHEMGHALRDIWDLPITGKEEDAVDQLAILLLLEDEREGEDAVLSSASWFLFNKEKIRKKDLLFWDEHSLNIQRFHNIVCWIYGTDPEYYAERIEVEYLPEERAIRCEEEFFQMRNSWNKILTPVLKK